MLLKYLAINSNSGSSETTSKWTRLDPAYTDVDYPYNDHHTIPNHNVDQASILNKNSTNGISPNIHNERISNTIYSLRQNDNSTCNKKESCLVQKLVFTFFLLSIFFFILLLVILILTGIAGKTVTIVLLIVIVVIILITIILWVLYQSCI